MYGWVHFCSDEPICGVILEPRIASGASLSLDKEKNVADVFYQPLLMSITGFVLLFVALVLIGTRTEIRIRRASASCPREDKP